jgi:hypothetical protein
MTSRIRVPGGSNAKSGGDLGEERGIFGAERRDRTGIGCGSFDERLKLPRAEGAAVRDHPRGPPHRVRQVVRHEREGLLQGREVGAELARAAEDGAGLAEPEHGRALAWGSGQWAVGSRDAVASRPRLQPFENAAMHRSPQRMIGE